MPVYVEVALPVPLRRNFSYRVPEKYVAALAIGLRVKVPFGRQQLIGLITAITDQCDLTENQIKNITQVLDSQAILPESLYKLTLWAARYYFTTQGQMLSQALPVALRKGADTAPQAITLYSLNEQGQQAQASLLNRAPAQKKLFDALKLQSITHDEFVSLEYSKAALKALEDKGWVERKTQVITIDLDWRQQLDVTETPHKLNKQQAVAVSILNQQQGFNCSLLEGITGSGKTEVYLAVLETVLKQGKQALILVPEIGLTPQTINRFKRRFAVNIAVIHSGLTDNQRLDAWRQARSGQAAIIIGTRSALFTPMPFPGVIILDEEHDSSFTPVT
jgi:primosomal protein N' (replication factor Y)